MRDLFEELWIDIDGPDFCGQLLMGKPHGVWLHFHGGGVRVTVWAHGELVEVLAGVG